MARTTPSDRLTRVGAYDMLGLMMVATLFVSVSILAPAPKEVRTDVGWAGAIH
ncbi:hypothetical protein ABTY98_17105 [Streptomyces sp. NPDC096040]|uniref:hypothetical protein n=1 Tax=Streptomyces sp. NPDC096040 TaxID=3155541 RepID=UPI00332954BF